jgi:hypothetical protein
MSRALAVAIDCILLASVIWLLFVVDRGGGSR